MLPQPEVGLTTCIIQNSAQICLFLPIYLFNCSFVSVRTHRCLFCISGYTLLNLVAKITPPCPLGILSVRFPPPFPSPSPPPPVPFLSRALPQSLALEDTVGSSCKFFAEVLESALFFKEPTLLLENGTRNQDLGTWCTCCCWGVSCFQVHSYDRARRLVCVLAHVYAQMCNHF